MKLVLHCVTYLLRDIMRIIRRIRAKQLLENSRIKRLSDGTLLAAPKSPASQLRRLNLQLPVILPLELSRFCRQTSQTMQPVRSPRTRRILFLSGAERPLRFQIREIDAKWRYLPKTWRFQWERRRSVLSHHKKRERRKEREREKKTSKLRQANSRRFGGKIFRFYGVFSGHDDIQLRDLRVRQIGRYPWHGWKLTRRVSSPRLADSKQMGII